jgi:hypothetical protein
MEQLTSVHELEVRGDHTGCSEREARHRLTPVILATWKAEIRRINASLSKKFMRPYLQNNQSKVDCRCDLSGGAPPLELCSTEFNSHQHNKK